MFNNSDPYFQKIHPLVMNITSWRLALKKLVMSVECYDPVLMSHKSGSLQILA